MSFRRHWVRLLWHWSLPLLMGAFLGAIGSTLQLFVIAEDIDRILNETVTACVEASR